MYVLCDTEEDLDCKEPDDCEFDLDVLTDEEARVYHTNGTIVWSTRNGCVYNVKLIVIVYVNAGDSVKGRKANINTNYWVKKLHVTCFIYDNEPVILTTNPAPVSQ